MLNIGPQELLLVLVIALIVVGPTRLPELGRSIGKGLRELRKAQDEVKRTIQVNLDEPAMPKETPRKAPTAAAQDETGAGGSTRSGDQAAVVAGGAVPAAGPDPVPIAGEPPQASEVLEISRTLGRSLAELRRAREEVQRGFKVNLTEARQPRPSADVAPEPAPGTEPAVAEAPTDAPPTGASADEAPAG